MFVLLTASVLATNKKKSAGREVSAHFGCCLSLFFMMSDLIILFIIAPVASVYVCARLELKSEK